MRWLTRSPSGGRSVRPRPSRNRSAGCPRTPAAGASPADSHGRRTRSIKRLDRGRRFGSRPPAAAGRRGPRAAGRIGVVGHGRRRVWQGAGAPATPVRSAPCHDPAPSPAAFATIRRRCCAPIAFTDRQTRRRAGSFDAQVKRRQSASCRKPPPTRRRTGRRQRAGQFDGAENPPAPSRTGCCSPCPFGV